jgi:cell division septation protein DedD
MGYRLLALVIGLGLALLASSVGLRAEEKTREGAPNLAILIVGDEGNAAMLREEKALIAEMTRLLTAKAEAGKPGDRFPHARTLQVYSYHFNQPRERQYCEKRLNILAEDLLFVGIVELEERLPRKVVYRLDRIVRARRSAEDVLSRAEEMLAPDTPVQAVEPEPDSEPTSPPSPKASPSPSTSPSPSASPSPAASPSPSSGAAQPIRPAAIRTPAGDTSTTAPSAPVVVRTPASAPRVTTWRVQVGSFAALANAQELVSQLKAKGHDSRIDHSTRNGVNLFRVYVGSSADRQGAQALLDTLKKDGFNQAFLVAPDEG